MARLCKSSFVKERHSSRKSGFQNEEILASVDLALLVKKSGYTIGKAIEQFSDFARLDRDNAIMKKIVLQQQVHHDFLLTQNLALEEFRSKNSQVLQDLEYVKGFGFGLQELRTLRHKLDEIDEQAGKSTGSRDSVEKFFRFFDEYYFDYYSASDKVEELKSGIVESSEKLEYLSSALGLTPEIAMMILSLARKGINRDDIPNLASKFEENHHLSNSILFKIDTISKRDSPGFKKPFPLVSEESNPSTYSDKRSYLDDTQVKTKSAFSSPKQKRIEDVVRGGKTSLESHQQVRNQDAQNCGGSPTRGNKKRRFHKGSLYKP
jgi:hypothetical protein